jgi:hypothetical protein
MIFRAVPFWNKRNNQATDSAVTGSASQLMLGLDYGWRKVPHDINARRNITRPP